MSDSKRYISIPAGFLMVLHQGDDVFAQLETLMRDQAIPAAVISGFGFVSKATFGFFDHGTKQYRPKTMTDLELTNLTGTLAWKDGEPAPHLHGTAGNKSFRTFGGHLLALEVGRGSLEISVMVIPTRLHRTMDHAIGANVMQL